MSQREFQSVDDYIGAQSETLQPVLKRLRSAIAAAAPDATEKISYQMPTFKARSRWPRRSLGPTRYRAWQAACACPARGGHCVTSR